ncbi:secreted immunoglobulin domain 1 isoform X2 [Seriola aureovittata]|uniref:secreted immunoglobulin domain 1 isoform X2 n=1 Tax=Seriola aureovittata TaxID=2871759 RepID=UPI0024BE5C29|nr:secreted immunoglobulin domain 1 isoform X2 [Seriola aureovittata]
MMESVLVCLILVSLSGFWWGHQSAALPASSVQVRVGEDATLPCPLLDNATTAAPPAYSTLSWYRKVTGGSPQLLLTIRSTNSSNVTFGSGVGPDKVSATADGSLLLRRSEHSDSAVYYCGISQGKEPKNKSAGTQRLTET